MIPSFFCGESEKNNGNCTSSYNHKIVHISMYAVEASKCVDNYIILKYRVSRGADAFHCTDGIF